MSWLYNGKERDDQVTEMLVEEPISTATLIEQRIAAKERETPNLLLDLRASLPTAAERAASAENFKAQANEQLLDGELEMAMRLYLTGVWLLKRGDPPLPAALTSKKLPSGASLLPALGDSGTAAHKAFGPISADEEHADGIGPVRRVLHLNLAQCALKSGDWLVVRAACEFVLTDEPTNVKALFRLARAFEGEGELSSAMGVLSARLLEVEPTHKEARTLLTTLRKRRGAEKAMFGDVFAKAAGGGGETDGLYSEAALREEARKRCQALIGPTSQPWAVCEPHAHQPWALSHRRLAGRRSTTG